MNIYLKVNTDKTFLTGAMHTMANVQPQPIIVAGTTQQGTVNLLDPVLLFKGKLGAVATRPKYQDSADLRWLENRFGPYLKTESASFDRCYVGLAIKRHPELESLFVRLGIHVVAAKALVAHLDIDNLPADKHGHVQEKLLG